MISLVCAFCLDFFFVVVVAATLIFFLEKEKGGGRKGDRNMLNWVVGR